MDLQREYRYRTPKTSILVFYLICKKSGRIRVLSAVQKKSDLVSRFDGYVSNGSSGSRKPASVLLEYLHIGRNDVFYRIHGGNLCILYLWLSWVDVYEERAFVDLIRRCCASLFILGEPAPDS